MCQCPMSDMIIGLELTINLLGGTILPRFLFHKLYVSGALTIVAIAYVCYCRPSANDN